MTGELHSVEFWAVSRSRNNPIPPEGTLADSSPAVLSVGDSEPLLDARARAVDAVKLEDGDSEWVEMLLATESDGLPDPAMALGLWEPFGVRADGSVVRFWPSFGNVTFGDLRRGVEAGFIRGRWDKVLLRTRGGSGGGNPVVDIIEFLGAAGVNWVDGGLFGGGLSYFAFKLLPKRVRTNRTMRAARKVAAQWAESHLDSPWDLRAFFDLKPVWTAKSVAKLLKVTPNLAIEILLATGHARRTGTNDWVLGASLAAMERKQKFDSLAETSFG